MKPPENVNETLDQVRDVHQQLRTGMKALPPSTAKDLLEELVSAAEPMVGQLREAYPKALSAFRSHKADLESKLGQAKENLAKAEQQFAQLPPIDKVSAAVTASAAAAPDGLADQLGNELRSRYQAPPSAAAASGEGPENAWQDWSLS